MDWGGVCGCAAAAENFSSNGVGGDGGGRGMATVQMPRQLKFYYRVGAVDEERRHAVEIPLPIKFWQTNWAGATKIAHGPNIIKCVRSTL